MSARITEIGTKYQVPSSAHETPKFTIIEDKEHTMRAVQAIRDRVRTERMAYLVNPKPEPLPLVTKAPIRDEQVGEMVWKLLTLTKRFSLLR